MSLSKKLIFSLIVAIISSLFAFLLSDLSGVNLLLLFLLLTASTISTTLVTSLPLDFTGIATGSDKDTDMDQRETGAVKWFNVAKGFGFISCDSGEEIFAHFRAIRGEGRRSLRDGQRVSFVIVQSDKGPQAEDIEILAGSR